MKQFDTIKKSAAIAILAFFSMMASGLSAQNFHVYMSMELNVYDPYAPTEQFQWVARMFVYKDGTSSFNDRRFENFSVDFSYDTTKLKNPRYYVVLNTRPILSPNDPYSASTQGIYNLAQTSTTVGMPANHVRVDVDVTASNTTLFHTNYVGADFNACLNCGEIMRVYFDIDSSSSNVPPSYYVNFTDANPVYWDPAATGFLADTVYNGISTQHHTAAPLNPAANPWFYWPYDATGSGANAGGLDPDWDLLSSAGGNTSSWSFAGYVTGVLTPLPVDLVSFTAIQTASGVDLRWITGSELNNDYFEIERSRDGRIWNTLGRVEGKGNSDGLTEYLFTDAAPEAGQNFYRLRQVDIDGAFHYSALRFVNFGGDFASQIVLYPNPATASLHLLLPDGLEDAFISEIRSVDGSQISSFAAGQDEAEVLDLKDLRPGMYLVYIRAGEQTIVRSFVKE